MQKAINSCEHSFVNWLKEIYIKKKPNEGSSSCPVLNMPDLTRQFPKLY